MCTLILLRRPGHSWPLLVAANRDEMLDRPWDPPGRWWPDRPGVIAGRDRSGGGTWLALGPQGVVAAVLNRPGSLGPAPGKRTRGELPLIAASAPTARGAAAMIAHLAADQWRPFNMIIADIADAYFVRSRGAGSPEIFSLDEGVSIVTAHDPNDPASPRIRRYLPRFRALPPPDPEQPRGWEAWEKLLADRTFSPAIGPAEALTIPPHKGFGTVCSSLLALAIEKPPLWRFCPAPPDRGVFRPLALAAIASCVSDCGTGQGNGPRDQALLYAG